MTEGADGCRLTKRGGRSTRSRSGSATRGIKQLPATVEFCPDWNDFYDLTRLFAMSASRRCGNDPVSSATRDNAVDHHSDKDRGVEWTRQNPFERTHSPMQMRVVRITECPLSCRNDP